MIHITRRDVFRALWGTPLVGKLLAVKLYPKETVALWRQPETAGYLQILPPDSRFCLAYCSIRLSVDSEVEVTYLPSGDQVVARMKQGRSLIRPSDREVVGLRLRVLGLGPKAMLDMVGRPVWKYSKEWAERSRHETASAGVGYDRADAIKDFDLMCGDAYGRGDVYDWSHGEELHGRAWFL